MKKVRLRPLVVFQKHGRSRTHGWAKVSQRFDRRAMAVDPNRLLPPPSRVGRPRRVCRRQVVNAILYVNRTGCQWRQLPRDFPKWPTVYDLFWHWRLHGVWQTIHDTLRQRVRRAEGRKATPSAAILDSQSVRTTEVGGERATTLAKRSPAASDIWLSIRWG